MIDSIEKEQIWTRPGILPRLARRKTATKMQCLQKVLEQNRFDGTDAVVLDGYSPAQHNALRKIGKTMAYMMQHLDQTLSVSALSTLAGFSPSYFFHVFKIGTGFTPTDFHIRVRMHRACVMLRETKLSVKEVSNLLGYDDQFYFSRLFRRVIGIPPSYYRAKMSDMNSQRS
jgi:AraC-like DNA-binding protein